MKYQLERSGQKRRLNAVAAAVRPGIISDKLNNAIATGNWGRGRVGVTQLLDRTNYISTNSHLRRIQSPLRRSQPNFEARDLHSTHFGRICPAETPEGSNCGLVKNIALSSIISVSVSVSEIIEKLYELGAHPVEEASDMLRKTRTKNKKDTRLNTDYDNGQHLTDTLRSLRRSGKLHSHVGIYYYSNENENATKRLYVSCNSGRILRPLAIVKDGKPAITLDVLDLIKRNMKSWSDLLWMGMIELIDANEEEKCYVSLNYASLETNHTNLEIYTPSII
jgi:DNA-directed RNA polymerase subunit B